MKDQEYYDYGKVDGRETYKESTRPESREKSHNVPSETTSKIKKSGCVGCYMILISIAMFAGGIITIIIARSNAPEKSMPINAQGEKTVIIQDVNPESKCGISMKVTLAGKHYYTYQETEHYTKGGKSYKRTVTRKALVHRVPYTVKAIRESNGEVVYDLFDEFETGNDETVKTQTDYLGNSPGFSKDIEKFDFTDKVRFEFTVNPDEKYKTVVEQGEVAVFQMSNARNATWQIALLITVLGFVGIIVGFIVAIIQYFVMAAKQKGHLQKNSEHYRN